MMPAIIGVLASRASGATPITPGSFIEAYSSPKISVQWEGVQDDLIKGYIHQLAFRVTSLLSESQVVNMKPGSNADSTIPGSNVPYNFSFSPMNTTSAAPLAGTTFTEFTLAAGESKVVYVLLNPTLSATITNAVITFDSEVPPTTLSKPYSEGSAYSSFRVLSVQAYVGNNRDFSDTVIESGTPQSWEEYRTYSYNGVAGAANPNIVTIGPLSDGITYGGFLSSVITVAIGLDYIPSDPSTVLAVYRDGMYVGDAYPLNDDVTTCRYLCSLSDFASLDVTTGDKVYQHTYHATLGGTSTPDFIFAVTFTQA